MNYRPENNIGEVEIIDLLHKNNEKGLAIIFKLYHKSLLFSAIQFLHNYQAAEDILIETVVKLWYRRNDFNSLPAIRSFLFISVKNACINHIKMTNRRDASLPDILQHVDEWEEFQEAEMIRAELLQRIWEQVEELPPVRQRIFKMFFKDGLNAFQIANKLQISVDTVRVQKARALHKLRGILGKKSF